MSKTSRIITVALCIAAALSLWMYNIGRKEGIRYAIEDSCFYIVDFYDEDAEGYDTFVYVELDDGNVYSHGMYIC